MSTPTDSDLGLDPRVAGFAQEPAPLERVPDAPDPAAPDPDSPSWGILPALGVLFASVLLMLVIQVIMVVPYALMSGTLDPKNKTIILLSLVSIIPAHLLTLAVAWAVVTGFRKRPFWRSLGWGWSPRYGRAEILVCVGLTIPLWMTGILLGKIFGDTEHELERLIMSSNAARYTVVALATFTAPVVEEIVFRGVLYSALRRRLGVAFSCAVVIGIFAAIHVPQYLPNVAAIATILVLSTALTVIRARTRRLLPCVLIHFIFNAASSLAILYSPYREQVAPPSPGPAPPAPAALLDAVGAALALIF